MIYHVFVLMYNICCIDDIDKIDDKANSIII